MNKATVLSLSINSFSRDHAVLTVESAFSSCQKTRVATINNEICNIAFSDKKYSDIVNSFELRVPDSAGVAWALKKQGVSTEVIRGVDLAMDMCEIAQKMSKSIFLLGGKKSVGSKAAEELKKQFGDLKIAGYLDGTVIEPEYDEKLVKKINDSGAEIVFVCLGAPKQEIWIDSNFTRLNAIVFVGLGGTLDFISKTIPRAPKFLRSIGLEWLFRFIIQPSRYKRIFSALVVFPIRVFKHMGKY